MSAAVLGRLRRLGIAGGVVVVCVLVLAAWLAVDAAPRTTAATPPQPVQHFISRPDLKPPKVTILHAARGTSKGLVFLAPKRAALQPGPMIIDDRGQVVWFKPLPTSGVTDFKVQRYRGKPVLTWWEGTVSMRGVGLAGGYRIVDSSYRLVKIVRAGHGLTGDIHEFRLLPGGKALFTVYRQVRADLSGLGGPTDGFVLEGVVQEVSVATGRVLFEWHSLPDVPLSESYLPVPENEGTSKDPYDYFHINSAEIDSDGNVLISARHTSAIYEINRRTHRIMWRLGGKKSTFTFGPGARFAWQHDARRQHDGTITLFDNAAQGPKKGVQSRGLRLRVDLHTHHATVVRSYRHRPALLSPSQGNAQFLSDGHVFVGWGQNPYFTEYSPSGAVLFDGKFGGQDVDSYRVFRFSWNARPLTKPDAVRRGHTVFVSWNGATDVVRWQVLAGRRPVASAAKNGFETRISVPSAAQLTIQAVDADGTVLGSTAVRS